MDETDQADEIQMLPGYVRVREALESATTQISWSRLRQKAGIGSAPLTDIMEQMWRQKPLPEFMKYAPPRRRKRYEHTSVRDAQVRSESAS